MVSCFKGNVRRERPHPCRRHAGPAAADRNPRVPAPRASPRRRAAAHRPIGGLRHRRAPVARPPRRCAVPDHSRTRVRRHARVGPRSAARHRRHAASRRRPRGVLRRPSHLRPLPRLHVHRTPTRCAARRVYGITDSATEGLFGGWSQAIYLEPGVGIARLPDAVSVDDYIGGGCGLLTAVHIIERATLSPAIPCSSRARARSA